MVGIISFYKDFVPLARHRCVESPHPTSCSPIKLCKLGGLMVSPYRGLIHYSLCGRMISAPAYFARSEQSPHSWLTSSRLPYRGA